VIQTAIIHAAAFPRVGRPQSVQGVRKIVTRRYPYVIYYRIDQSADEVVILTIQHAARDQSI
jgi:plasmid stabilization system protein ParE